MLSLDLITTAFSLANARTCASLAHLAYAPVAAPLLGPDWELVAEIKNDATSTECLVVRHGEALVIAFRGTQQGRDWFTDLQVRRQPRMGTRIQRHRGFVAAFVSIITDLQTLIDRHHSGPIFFTGHSLGGALAMLAADELVWAKGVVPHVYTFGQPRVGNAAFRNNYRWPATTWRFIHDLDAVPRLPGYLMGYRHAGQEIHVDSEGEWHVNPTFPEKVAIDVVSVLDKWIAEGHLAALYTLGDHAMENYLALLNDNDAPFAATALAANPA